MINRCCNKKWFQIFLQTTKLSFNLLTCKTGIKGQQNMINGFQTVLEGHLKGWMPSGHIIPFYLLFLLSSLFAFKIQAQLLLSTSPLLAVWSQES